MICPLICGLPRCMCPPGTVLKGQDRCVSPDKCQKKEGLICTGDLVFSGGCGSMCTLTCDTKTMLCPMGCAPPRCQCPGGTVLVGKDKCIKPEECPRNDTTTAVPKRCPGNLEFSLSGSSCTRTCASKEKTCAFELNRPKCRCPDGMVLASKGNCVLPESCPDSS